MSEAIHAWFNLTYANYLVLPRSVLQSMPEEWQERFVKCLKEMDEEFGHLDWPPYDVRALARETRHISTSECEECHGTGTDDQGQTCEYCDGDGVVDDDRWETPEEVGIITDPIPHYNRGRTKLVRTFCPSWRDAP